VTVTLGPVCQLCGTTGDHHCRGSWPKWRGPNPNRKIREFSLDEGIVWVLALTMAGALLCLGLLYAVTFLVLALT
jgi:hypothetical protein